MHAKFWIFDKTTAIIGDENRVDSDYLSTGFNGRNRDVDVQVKGPAVTDMMSAFERLYDRYVHTDHQIRNHDGIEEYRTQVELNKKQQTLALVRGREN